MQTKNRLLWYWSLLLVLVGTATARLSFPTLGGNLRGADTIIIGTVLSEPKRVSVVRMNAFDESAYSLDEFPLSVTNVLDELVQMTDKYAKADFRAERQILWDTISLYYWAWECQVEVLEVLRGTVSTNNVTVRQLFTYTGATENATVTAKLVAQHHYVLFLSDRSNALGAGRFELTPFSLAVLQSPSYVIKGGGREPESITHKEFLRLIQRSSVDQFLLGRWIEPENSEMQN